MTKTPRLRFQQANESYLDRIIELEQLSYPEDEAASPQGIQRRLQEACDYFVVALNEQHQLVGFVNGTCTTSPLLDEETMSQHEPSGRYLCIHSVVIAPEFRKQGFAHEMLAYYVNRIVYSYPHIHSMLLIAKAHLVHLYNACGFNQVRLSSVVHGKDKWFEMRLHCPEHRQLPYFLLQTHDTRISVVCFPFLAFLSSMEDFNLDVVKHLEYREPVQATAIVYFTKQPAIANTHFLVSVLPDSTVPMGTLTRAILTSLRHLRWIIPNQEITVEFAQKDEMEKSIWVETSDERGIGIANGNGLYSVQDDMRIVLQGKLNDQAR